MTTENTRMKLRLWIGLVCVVLIAAGSVAAALVVHADDSSDFHQMQRAEAIRAAHQAESMAQLSVGQLASTAAFFQVEDHVDKHEFRVISHSLLKEDVLTAAALIERVPQAKRKAFEGERGFPITERAEGGAGLRPARSRPVYFPLTLVGSDVHTSRGLGFDLGSDPGRAPYLEKARDSGHAVATPLVQLLLGGDGINVYQAIYRDRAPTATVAERRQALIGYAAGAVRVSDLAESINQALPDQTVEQIRIDGKRVSGPQGELEDPAAVQVHVADRVWLLVVRDPNRPDVSLSVLLAAIGIAVAALLGSLIFVWSRNERMQRLEREAGEDALTGLRNRRRFEEDVRAAMARRRRDRGTGALLMIDLDHFKEVNDTHGHLAGDRLIEEVAAVLRGRARAGDIVARLGGDEFAVVLPRSTPAEARVVAEAMVTAIREHDPTLDGVDPVTASVGVATFGSDHRMSYATLVSEADTAMYAAKDGGRNGVRVFDPEAIREDAPDSV